MEPKAIPNERDETNNLGEQQAGSSNGGPPSLDGSSQRVRPEKARKFSIQRCIQSLVHACQCRDAGCQLASCRRMKRVVQHIKTCKKRCAGGCPICKQLVALCTYHARHCQEADCAVPFCFNIKQKLRQHHQRIQQAQLLRLRMDIINAQPTKIKDPVAESSEAMETCMSIHGIGL